jgi:hypothetical protein
VEKKTICSFELTEQTAATFRDAVANIYWFEFFMGELFPIFWSLKECLEQEAQGSFVAWLL